MKLLALFLATCLTASAATNVPAYDLLEKELPSGTKLKSANIVVLGQALRLALRKHQDNAVPLLRVAVLLRCRKYAVADSNVPNNPSSFPRRDILHLLRIAVEIYPQYGASFISDSISVCGDVALAAGKIVLTETKDLPEGDYPGLIPVPSNPPTSIFTPITPVQNR